MTQAVKIVLIGAGHAHLVCLKQVEKLKSAGAAITLIEPGNFFYSGMATAILEGLLPEEAGMIDPEYLCQKMGVRFIRDSVVKIDRQKKTLTTAQGILLSYDCLSINTGSRVNPPFPIDESVIQYAIKPISKLLDLRVRLMSHSKGKAHSNPSICIIGGGASGCEIAAALAAWGKRQDLNSKIQIIQPGAILPAPFTPRARNLTARRLAQLGVALVDARGEEIKKGRLHLKDKSSLPCDIVIMATGLAPQVEIEGLESSLSPEGGIRVGSTLQTLEDPSIFAAGDCASFSPQPLPKIGVYGVRQGAHLVRAFHSVFKDQDIPPFRPQRKTLLILNLGGKTGLASWGRFSEMGGWAWKWKALLDQRFMDRMAQHTP